MPLAHAGDLIPAPRLSRRPSAYAFHSYLARGSRWISTEESTSGLQAATPTALTASRLKTFRPSPAGRPRRGLTGYT
ncbi:MAG: hypothetical protein ACO2PN_23940 [Pyrobaculum sp.]